MTTTATAPARCPHGTGPKISYRSRRDAELAAWRLLARSGRWLRCYRCDGCGAWHLTHWRARDRETGR